MFDMLCVVSEFDHTQSSRISHIDFGLGFKIPCFYEIACAFI